MRLAASTKRVRRLPRNYTEIQNVSPDDLIHAVPAIEGAAAIGTAVLFTGIVKRMLGLGR